VGEPEVDPGTPAPPPLSMFGVGDSPFGRSLARLGLVRDGRITPGRATLLSVGVTWLPLLFLSLVEGVAWGGVIEVPFLNDFLPYGQFFFAVPALILAELVIGRRLAGAAAELYRSGVVTPESRPALSRLFDRAASAWDGPVVNGVILVLTIAAIVASVIEVREWLTGGWQYTGGRLTLPGWWYLLVSGPLFQFILFRWIWRFLIWAGFLFRVSRIPLALHATHPDLSGGLGMLGLTQQTFSVVFVAFATVMSSTVAHNILLEGDTFEASRPEIFVFVLICVVVIYAPLFFFTNRMYGARRLGLSQYGALGHRLSGAFYAKWVKGVGTEVGTELKDSTDASAMADYGATFDVVRSMRPIPVSLRSIVTVAAALVAPFLPLYLTEFSFADLLQRMAGALV